MVIKIVLAFVLCVFATTVITSQGPEPLGVDARIAVAAVWIVGVAFMIWTIARTAKHDVTRSR